LPAARLRDPAVREAWLAVLGTIESDSEMTEVLQRVIGERAVKGELAVALLGAAAKGIDSDSEMTELLQNVPARLRADPAVRDALLAALATVESDSEASEVAAAWLSDGARPDFAAALLAEAAKDIDSDAQTGRRAGGRARCAARGARRARGLRGGAGQPPVGLGCEGGPRAPHAAEGMRAAALALLLAAAAHAGDLSGHWEGAFVRDGAVQLVALDVAGPAGASATLDIPELGMFGEPVPLTIADDVVQLHCVYGDFVLHLHADLDELTGGNDRWGPPLRLHLKREPAPSPVVERRPVTFRSGGVELSGTLLLPAARAAGAHLPGVVTLHGSANGQRGVWEYRTHAELLVRAGLAVLLYDRRGSGQSGGDADAPFSLLADDALAALASLRSQPEVDAVRVGLLGPSQGGWIALLAASRSRDVAFLLLLSAPAVSVHEQELQRVEATLRANGASTEDIAAATAFTRAMLAASRDGAADDAARSAAWAQLRPAAEVAAKQPWAEVVQVPSGPADLKGFGTQDFDPAAIFSAVKCPVFAQAGELDTLVPPALNLEPLRAALEQAGNAHVQTRLWPRADHRLEQQRELRTGEWNWPDGDWVWSRLPADLAPSMARWIATLPHAGG